MSVFTKRTRLEAALQGEMVDRPPVAAWRHFIAAEYAAAPLAEAHLCFFREYDWDWLKINPRATYYAEAWGARYDYNDYQGVLPRLVVNPFRTPDDLDRIQPCSIETAALAEQLDLVRHIRASIADVHVVQTLFSPLSVLMFLLARPEDPRSDEGLILQIERLRTLLRHYPAIAHRALNAIAETLASYAGSVVAAGASGIFFAIVRLARVGALSIDEFATFGVPYDWKVLEAVRHAPFNILHICGPKVYFDQACRYPVHAINWATQGQGNPTLAEARALTGKALIGGIDEHGALLHGTPEDVLAEAHQSLGRAGQVGILLAPGCAVDESTPPRNLRALRRAVEPANL
ncbi:MAG: uroporphyrinogen decarboxylase family protein [Roseiflexaceae bacterium]|nr:uroporphyrinogen decarboxylase family protein [Roseiflexaceae bacterium]